MNCFMWWLWLKISQSKSCPRFVEHCVYTWPAMGKLRVSCLVFAQNMVCVNPETVLL